MQLIYIIVYSFLQSLLEGLKCTIIKNVHYIHKLSKYFFFFHISRERLSVTFSQTLIKTVLRLVGKCQYLRAVASKSQLNESASYRLKKKRKCFEFGKYNHLNLMDFSQEIFE